MNNDYIKRSDAIEETRKPWTTRAELRRRICNIPPAKVRPAVCGHMIGREEAEKIFEEDYSDYPFGQCSVCGHCDWDCVESEGFNYCPNCGAYMREDSNDDT